MVDLTLTREKTRQRGRADKSNRAHRNLEESKLRPMCVIPRPGVEAMGSSSRVALHQGAEEAGLARGRGHQMGRKQADDSGGTPRAGQRWVKNRVGAIMECFFLCQVQSCPRLSNCLLTHFCFMSAVCGLTGMPEGIQVCVSVKRC